MVTDLGGHLGTYSLVWAGKEEVKQVVGRVYENCKVI